VDAASIEHVGGRHVVQYRGHLMPLVPFDASQRWKESGQQETLVFSDNGRCMGLAVDEVVDIVRDRMAIELSSDRPGLLGSAVIAGKAVDIVDVGHFLTQAFTDWFETGFYIFTSLHNGQGWDYVGNHIRPRVRIPPKWKWPVGLSLSNEIGYQRAKYSADTWTWEMRPIIDKQIDKWYFSFNPTFDKSFHGPSVRQGFVFSPNVKFSYDFTKKITGGLEYYGSVGPATDFDPIHLQEHQIYPAIDLNLSPKWEINFGVGVGLTGSTDHLIAKTIIGYRFDF
jgi:hypothetical protein